MSCWFFECTIECGSAVQFNYLIIWLIIYEKEIIQTNNLPKNEKIQRNNLAKIEKIQRFNLTQIRKIPISAHSAFVSLQWWCIDWGIYNFWIIVIQCLVLIAIVGVMAETIHEFRSPTETVAPGYVEHLIECLLGDESVVHHVDKYRCANDALVDNNAPVVVGLVVHLGLRPHVESLTHFLDECGVVGIVEQGIDNSYLSRLLTKLFFINWQINK